MFWPEDCRSFTNKLIFEMDTTALFSISYGLYIVGTMDGRRPVGCTINTCFQVTSENPLLAISLNKNNYTLDAIRRNKRFSLSVVAEDTDNFIIATFGFSSSRTVDKYEDFGYRMLRDVPIVNGKFCSRLVLDAVNFVDCETHVVVVARLIDAVSRERESPQTRADLCRRGSRCKARRLGREAEICVRYMRICRGNRRAFAARLCLPGLQSRPVAFRGEVILS